MTSIGDGAFSGCSSLTSIVVEAGNTVYDSRNNCNAIIKTSDNELIAGCQNTIIPSSVTSIGEDAFWGCSGLTAITIPSSVTSIGRYAFYCCSSLTSITIPSSVTSIGKNAFSGCSGLTSVTVGAMTPIAIHESCFTNRENATLYVPHGSKAAYDDAESWKDFNKIEEMFTGTVTDGLGVKYTENNDFTCYVSGHEDSYDACIVIPNCFHGRIVSSIGGNAFEDCSSLTSISIPNSVTSIGSNAFSGCNNLTSVTVISETPVEVTNNVFSNRENATLYVPAGSVDDYQTADYWKDFNIEELFTGTVADEQGVRYTANSDGSCSVSGREDNLNASIVIPKIVQGRTVASIGDDAFSGCSGLTAITIGNSVTSIGYDAFYGCSGLTSIAIPSSVTSIGDDAFLYCSGLTSIVVEAGNTVYDSRNNCNAIIKTSDNELIAGCQNTIIPNSVTSIGDDAFSGCSGLTAITIPSSVTSIGAYAFSDCSGLTAITIGNSVTSIGVEAFLFCSGLTAIVVEAGNTVYDSRNNCNAIIKTSDNELIAGCQNTIIPNSVTSIGYEAFQSCSGLTAITIPNSVTSIGSFAFSNCSGLTSITIPNSVTSIGGLAFSGCSGLTAITIPSSVTSIGDWAFSGCSGLTSITIPSSVTSIGYEAFRGCSGLTSVFVDKAVPIAINSSCFTNPANATLYVPKGSKAAYEAADFWKEFKEIIEMVNVADISQIDNVLYIEPLEASSGETKVELSIKMKNTAAIRGFQFDLVLPAGVTPVTEDNEMVYWLNGDRAPKKAGGQLYHTIDVSVQDNGSYRFLCGAQQDKTFAGNDGEVVVLKVNIAEDMKVGDYPITLRDIKLTETDISNSYQTESVVSKLTIVEYEIGDISGDGVVDVSDYIGVANHILGKTPAVFNAKAADVNKDNAIDVSDYIGVANIILTGTINGKTNSAAPAMNPRQDNMREPQ